MQFSNNYCKPETHINYMFFAVFNDVHDTRPAHAIAAGSTIQSHPVAETRLAVQQRQLPVRAVQADEKGKLKVHAF